MSFDQAAIDRTWNNNPSIDQSWNIEPMPAPFNASASYQQSAPAPAAFADPNQQFFGPVDDLQTVYDNYEYSDIDAYLAEMNGEQPSADQQ